ncbi:unnamed protein product [Caenorhabditis bovis]|uniref:CHHC U11-48K-type domain-containing protein n=1 Tax=Caenorhabditis bovis TaxID=2654633 RepID=A0A8S1FB52_9PELO|nr:unnamed protein product [Caenorhabditis bovis]
MRDFQIDPCEFNLHILKCRMEFMTYHPQSLKLVRCSYNTRHFIPQPELAFHEAFCKLGKFANVEKELKKPFIPVEVSALLDQLAVDSDEDSDDDDDDDSSITSKNTVGSTISDVVENSDDVVSVLESYQLRQLNNDENK